MTRIKRGFVARKRRKKLNLTKGFVEVHRFYLDQLLKENESIKICLS
jgi:ribosomal protein L20